MNKDLKFLKGTALWTKTWNQKRAVYANSTSTVEIFYTGLIIYNKRKEKGNR